MDFAAEVEKSPERLLLPEYQSSWLYVILIWPTLSNAPDTTSERLTGARRALPRGCVELELSVSEFRKGS